LGGHKDGVVVGGFGIDDVSEVFVVELEDAGGDGDAGVGADAFGAVNHDAADFTAFADGVGDYFGGWFGLFSHSA